MLNAEGKPMIALRGPESAAFGCAWGE